jgi:prepilin-type N-terminal cleavage/methylation domain-containing protein
MTSVSAQDDGFTLVEMLVVTVLMGLVSILVTTFAINTWRNTGMITSRVNDIDQARIGIDATSKLLRVAVKPSQLQAGCLPTTCTGPAATDTAISAATDLSVRFYANVGAAAVGPDLVNYSASYDSNRRTAVLTETRQSPDTGSAPNFTYTACTPGVAGCTIRSIPRIVGLTSPTATSTPTPIFRCYDTNGLLVVGSTVGGVTGVLSPSQLATVAAVEVTLPVHSSSTGQLGSTTLVNRIFLPNSAIGA